MSLYDYGQPVSTNEYRDRTAREKMLGVQYQNAIQCHGGCGQRKPIAGGTKRGGKFVCADCSKPAGIFAALLLGERIKLPRGKARVVTFAGNEERAMPYGEAVRLQNLEKIREAIRDGFCTIQAIRKRVGLTDTTTSRRLAELVDMGELVRKKIDGRTSEWKLKGAPAKAQKKTR